MPTLDEVYRKFGKVSEAAQLLETELGTMLLSVQATEHDLFASDKGELATEILEKINKSTFGELIRKLAKAARFSGTRSCSWRTPLLSEIGSSIPSIGNTTSDGTPTRAVRRCSKTCSASTR